MKKLILGVSIILLFFSCTNEARPSGENPENHFNSEAIYRAIETGDVTALDTILAEDVVDHEGGPAGGPIRGRDSVKAVLANLHRQFNNLDVNVITEARNNDYHFSLVKMTGTTADSTFAPRGTTINTTFVDVVRLRDGKVVEHWGFRDPNDMMQMMQYMQTNQNMPQQNSNPLTNKTDPVKNETRKNTPSIPNNTNRVDTFRQ